MIRIRLVKGESGGPANGLVWHEDAVVMYQAVIEEYRPEKGGWVPVEVIKDDC